MMRMYSVLLRFSEVGLYVGSVVITQVSGQKVLNYSKRLEKLGIKVYTAIT